MIVDSLYVIINMLRPIYFPETNSKAVNDEAVLSSLRQEVTQDISRVTREVAQGQAELIVQFRGALSDAEYQSQIRYRHCLRLRFVPELNKQHAPTSLKFL
jgi:hypothetical protein